MFFSLVILLAAAAVPLSLCAPQGDLVVNLPGLEKQPNFKHYSGYLNASDDLHLHYWFVESQSDPSSDPVVLWLNGGPGCSSLFGLLGEHGPFRINMDKTTVYYNDYSWNKDANVLYLESPAGVGYSYSDSGSYDTGDNLTAVNNLAALKNFFSVFPEYKPNEFYITGESYAGIYVPTLAVRVLEDDTFNFKGFAIGNGLHSYDIDEATDLINLGYHALFGAQTLTKVLQNCCPDGDITQCKFYGEISQECADAVKEAYKSLNTAEYNGYYIYDECFHESAEASFIVDQLNRFRKGLKKVVRTKPKKVDRYDPTQDPDCFEMDSATTWLNSDVVRQALHIPEDLPRWADCSAIPYGIEYSSTAEFYKVLLPKVRGLIYNGDADTACSYLHGQYFAESLGLKVLQDYEHWHYDDRSAGIFKVYENLTFVTILNAGHMVPIYQPGPAQLMFENFIHNKPFQ